MSARPDSAQHDETMTRERRPFDQALAVIGLTGRLVGDDPARLRHLRLAVGGRAVIWPIEPDHGELAGEIRLAVADMVANTALLSRSGRDVAAWAAILGLDPHLERTKHAYATALVLDAFAEQLLTRRTLDGLLDGTTWRDHLRGDRLPGVALARTEGAVR
jgi:hypothetical protein